MVRTPPPLLLQQFEVITIYMIAGLSRSPPNMSFGSAICLYSLNSAQALACQLGQFGRIGTRLLETG